ncbi:MULTISPECIES: fimbrial protein [Serratia]|uniref:fimbrial protein n=1 Tax=Serratia TaxID=613 RepID=UPI001F5479D0|nr:MULTISPECIES: fimbrial protein [Serratia]
MLRMSVMSSVALTGMLLSLGAHAVDVNFRGTLIDPPPCTINGGTDVDVNFGSTVLTTRVDGVNYRMAVPLNIVCTAPPLNTMRLQFVGTGAPFDASVLNTDKTDLGIKLYSGTGTANPVDVNAWLNFTYPTFPAIEAVLVKNPGSTLTSGVFSAASTVLLDWQ